MFPTLETTPRLPIRPNLVLQPLHTRSPPPVHLSPRPPFYQLTICSLSSRSVGLGDRRRDLGPRFAFKMSAKRASGDLLWTSVHRSVDPTSRASFVDVDEASAIMVSRCPGLGWRRGARTESERERRLRRTESGHVRVLQETTAQRPGKKRRASFRFSSFPFCPMGRAHCVSGLNVG